MNLIGENIVISDKAVYYLENFIGSKNYSSIFILCDENTEKYCLPQISGFDYHRITIASGENHKTLHSCTYIWEKLSQGGADRHSLLINLGGGVIGDMGGFAASTYMRGIDFIQVPTTLLAMVDASVGGKTGVDFMHHKNRIGVFAQPAMVFIQPPFLETLDQRQVMSGYAEMLKHGLILNEDYWNDLRHFNKRRLKLQIEESIHIKSHTVEEDPLEAGYRKILNFGHTVGHGIESFCLETGRDVLHGEAVAAGMFMEAVISAKTGLNKEETVELCHTLNSLYPKLPLKPGDEKEIWEYMLRDKKNKADKVNCTLLSSIGHALFDKQITFPEFAEAFRYYLGY